MLKGKMRPAEIAAEIGCSVRTIYRELRRGRCEVLQGGTYKTITGYSADLAQTTATRHSSGPKPKLLADPALAEMLCYLIKRGHYSPAAAIQELRLQGIACTVCANTIYRGIHHGILPIKGSDLPVGYYRKKKVYTKRSLYVSKRHLSDRSISDRPEAASNRQTFGHWEIDTVVGRRTGTGKCLCVLTERKTRFEVLRLLDRKTMRAVHRSLSGITSANGDATSLVFKSLTCDNGSEFSDAALLEQFAPTYFCHPYSSWERGSNENQNKLIHRFVLKGKSMNQLTDSDVECLQLWMNHYPRKALGWQRPVDLFAREPAVLGVEQFLI